MKKLRGVFDVQRLLRELYFGSAENFYSYRGFHDSSFTAVSYTKADKYMYAVFYYAPRPAKRKK